MSVTGSKAWIGSENEWITVTLAGGKPSKKSS